MAPEPFVTNRWLGLPIFAVVMFLVYWVAMVGVGAPATDWANDGLFGDGWHLFGIGTAEYPEVADNYTAAMDAVSGYYELDTEAENFDADAALADMKAVQPDADSATIDGPRPGSWPPGSGFLTWPCRRSSGTRPKRT